MYNNKTKLLVSIHHCQSANKLRTTQIAVMIGISPHHKESYQAMGLKLEVITHLPYMKCNYVGHNLCKINVDRP